MAMLLLFGGEAAAAPGCLVSNITSVNFGIYDVFSAVPLDSVGTVTVRCGQDTPNLTISINPGSSPTFSPRWMKSTRLQPLIYDLYLDAAHTVLWGDGSGGTQRYGPVTMLQDASTTVYIYARVPALQVVAPGDYSETLTVTLNF